MTVKELAGALGRHSSYVYKARAVGFTMRNGMATLAQWRGWCRRVHYRVVHGEPKRIVPRSDCLDTRPGDKKLA